MRTYGRLFEGAVEEMAAGNVGCGVSGEEENTKEQTRSDGGEDGAGERRD